jgi:hypothetical protein
VTEQGEGGAGDQHQRSRFWATPFLSGINYQRDEREQASRSGEMGADMESPSRLRERAELCRRLAAGIFPREDPAAVALRSLAEECEAAAAAMGALGLTETEGPRDQSQPTEEGRLRRQPC